MFSFENQYQLEAKLDKKLTDSLEQYSKCIKRSCDNKYQYFTEYMQSKTKIVKNMAKKENKDFHKAEQFVQLNELFIYPIWTYHSSAEFVVNLKQHFDVLINNFTIWLTFINQLLAGKILRNTLEKLEIGESSLLEFYVLQIVRGAILFVLIPLEIPQFSKNGELKGFKYVQSLKFMNKQTYYQAYKFRNIAKHFLQNSLIERNLADMEFKAQAQIPADMTYFTPLMFDDLLLTPEEAAKYVYDEKRQRWMNTNIYQQLKKQDEDRESVLANKYLIKKYADFSSAAKLVELIQNIPNFKIQMTEEEKEVVSANGDVIVIGRSGTGKTTCAILRLFSMNMLFKLRVNLLCKKQFIEEINLEDDFSSTALRSIFITSSPVLACEVKRYYKSITQHLQEQINKKRSKTQSQQQNIDINNLEQSTIQYIESVNETKQENKDEFERIEEDEVEEVDDYEVQEYEKEMGDYNQFSDIKAYPVFFTLRKLILLIDASLVNPFFKRNNLQVIEKRSAQWHNEQSGTLMINRNVVQSVNLEMDGNFIPMQSQQYRQTDIPEVQEVTFEIFKLKFWPLIYKEMKEDFKRTEFQADAQYLWSQIYSQIKGSSNSYQCPGMCLNEYTYTYNFSKERIDRGKIIYKCFIKYENLKRKLKYYDILDVVNYISVQLDKKLHCFVPLHYLIVDEMQDLPMAIFSMLSKIVELGLYLSGDTAQNIVKGVGFRSNEIKQMLVRTPRIVKEHEVSIYNLTFNFRSHNSILQLANSVISFLELCFPKNIDRLQKETSNWDGPKPIILQCEDQESLFFFLQNGSIDKKIEFGCNQTILVKQQDSKRLVPSLLQHAIILTIYEAKGLEFEDVILYNFFSDNYLGKQAWNILKYLEVIEQTVSQEEYQNMIYRRQEETSIVETSDLKKETIKIKRLGLNKKCGNISEANQSLCQSLLSELKLLYVAVTRPKNRLIIYDSNPECRAIIQKIWVQLGVVQVIDQKDLLNININSIEQNKIFQKITTSKQEWKTLGHKMFKQGHFSQAVKCFKIVEDKNLINKAQAFSNAAEGVVLKQKLEELKLQGKTKQVTQQIKELTGEKNRVFKSAADYFIQIDQKQRAAQCYFSAEEYSQALILFTELECIQEMAETTFFLKDYQVSAKYFHQLGDVYREIECYQQAEDYFSLIKVLKDSKDLIEQDLRSAYINKYLPIILNILTDKVEKAEKNTQIIQEDDEDDEDEVSFEVDQQQPSEQFSIQDSQVEIVNIDQSLHNNQTQSFSVNEKQQQEASEFENVSFFDPDDEWIQNDKQSIIESIISKESQKSDFSAILMGNNPTIELVNTKQNIYVQEEVVQQLIQYFSAFSNEFKQHLLNQHHKAVHLSNRSDEDKDFDYMIDFMLEIDSIDIDTIYLMLDILEEFKAYKLCIFVCNKFKLATKLGRYLVSVASEYSPFYQNGNAVTPNMINKKNTRNTLMEQSLVSTFAVHNILETINPQFIQPKFENQPLSPYNSLGQQTYQEMITLGFWKKVLFQLDYENALMICEAFQDQVNWKYLYMQNRIMAHKDNEMKQLEQNMNFQLNFFGLINFEFPQTEVQYKLCVVSFEHYILHIIPYLIGLRRLPQNFLHNGDQIKTSQIDQLFDPSQINQLFNLSKQVFQAIILNKIISPEILKQLNSTQVYKYSKNHSLKLKYFEAAILSEIILQYSIIKPEQINQTPVDEFIEFIDFTYKKHNTSQNKKKYNNEHHPSIYKVSQLNGQYLKQFQSYQAIHISSPLISLLLKKNPQDLQFLDIHYEFMACPTEHIVAVIRQWQCQLQQQIFDIKANQLSKCLTQVHAVQLFDNQTVLHELSVLVTMKSYNNDYRNGGLHDYYYQNQKWCDVPNEIEYYHDYLFYTQIFDRVNLVFLNQLQLAHCRSNVKLNKIIVTTLSRIAMQQLSDYNSNSQQFKDNQRLIIISILILHYCDQNQFALQFLQKIETQLKKPLKYRQFVEYLECRNYNCIDDQLDLYFDYYSQMKSVIDYQTIINFQTLLTLQYLIAYSLKNYKEIIIPLHYLKFLGTTKIVKPHTIFEYIASIQELQNENFMDEILEIINNLIIYSEDMNAIEQGKLLIYVILLNLVQPTAQFLQQIEFLWASQKSTEKLKYCEEIVSQSKLDLISRRKAILNKHNQINLPFSEDYVCTVKIINDEIQLEEQYNNCLNKWESYTLVNQQIKKEVIHLEQVIINSNFMTKIKSQRQKSESDCSFQNQYNVFERLLNKSLTSFTSPIDLHYINQLQQQIQAVYDSQKIQKILEIKKEFQLWLELNVQSDEQQRQAILLRNKKLLELKWLNLKAGIKVQRPKIRKIGK